MGNEFVPTLLKHPRMLIAIFVYTAMLRKFLYELMRNKNTRQLPARFCIVGFITKFEVILTRVIVCSETRDNFNIGRKNFLLTITKYVLDDSIVYSTVIPPHWVVSPHVVIDIYILWISGRGKLNEAWTWIWKITTAAVISKSYKRRVKSIIRNLFQIVESCVSISKDDEKSCEYFHNFAGRNRCVRNQESRNWEIRRKMDEYVLWIVYWTKFLTTNVLFRFWN